MITSFGESSVFEINSDGEVVWTYEGYLHPRMAIKYPYNYFYSDGNETINIDYIFHEGWNLVGLPIEVENASYNVLFPESIDGTLYSFNDGYNPEIFLVNGNGYWLRFNESESSTNIGISLNEITISLIEGWNLISGISLPVDLNSIVDNAGIIVSETFFEFSPGGYSNAEILEPGKGYWIRANSSGSIIIEN